MCELYKYWIISSPFGNKFSTFITCPGSGKLGGVYWEVYDHKPNRKHEKNVSADQIRALRPDIKWFLLHREKYYVLKRAEEL